MDLIKATESDTQRRTWPPAPERGNLSRELVDKIIQDAVDRPPVKWIDLMVRLRKDAGMSTAEAHKIVTALRREIDPTYDPRALRRVVFPMLAYCCFIAEALVAACQDRPLLVAGTGLAMSASLILLQRR